MQKRFSHPVFIERKCGYFASLKWEANLCSPHTRIIHGYLMGISYTLDTELSIRVTVMMQTQHQISRCLHFRLRTSARYSYPAIWMTYSVQTQCQANYIHEHDPEVKQQKTSPQNQCYMPRQVFLRRHDIPLYALRDSL